MGVGGGCRGTRSLLSHCPKEGRTRGLRPPITVQATSPQPSKMHSVGTPPTPPPAASSPGPTSQWATTAWVYEPSPALDPAGVQEGRMRPLPSGGPRLSGGLTHTEETGV